MTNIRIYRSITYFMFTKTSQPHETDPQAHSPANPAHLSVVRCPRKSPAPPLPHDPSYHHRPGQPVSHARRRTLALSAVRPVAADSPPPPQLEQRPVASRPLRSARRRLRARRTGSAPRRLRAAGSRPPIGAHCPPRVGSGAVRSPAISAPIAVGMNRAGGQEAGGARPYASTCNRIVVEESVSGGAFRFYDFAGATRVAET